MHLLCVYLIIVQVFLQLILFLSIQGNDSMWALTGGCLHAGFMSILAWKNNFNTALLEAFGNMSL